MSFERLVENKIREAIANGEFDNLPGRGRPLDLDDYFNTPAELRLGYAMLKSAHCLPAEVELRREIEALQTQLAECTDAHEQASLRHDIQSKTLKLKLLNDTQRRHAR